MFPPLNGTFPLGPAGPRHPEGDQAPSTNGSRPWGLKFAAAPMPGNATWMPQMVYDPIRQINLDLFGGDLPYLGTHKQTVPDGNVDSPPPLDEGEKD